MWRPFSLIATNPAPDKHGLSGGFTVRHSTGPNLRSVLASPAAAIATVCGAGLFPIWPGLIGSALALPLVHFTRPLDLAAKGALYFAMFLICLWAAHGAGRQFGEPDHGAIICDETWSMAVVWECTPADFRWMLASFIAFRVLDVAKPWPICTVDRVMKNGLGVMLDDVLAGIGAILAVLALHAAIVGTG